MTRFYMVNENKFGQQSEKSVIKETGVEPLRELEKERCLGDKKLRIGRGKKEKSNKNPT